MKKINWDIDLSPMVNATVRLETREGFIRLAKLTDIRFQRLELQGYQVEIPIEVVLDTDDPIPFAQIRSMGLAD